MKLLREDSLLSDVAYMLDKDGNLFSCKEIHPYLINDIYDDVSDQLNELLQHHKEDVKWFIEHTKNDELKTGLQHLLIEGDEFDLDRFKELNNMANEEWLRIRCSTAFGPIPSSIYFRVSSKDFNWFNLIWKLAYENKDRYDTVTICKDEQATGEREYYYGKGDLTFNLLPINEFLNIKGNPVIESI